MVSDTRDVLSTSIFSGFSGILRENIEAVILPSRSYHPRLAVMLCRYISGYSSARSYFFGVIYMRPSELAND